MRPLKKLPAPAELIERQDDLTRQYLVALDAGVEPPAVWRKGYIRDALKRECASRCAYCDASISHVTFGDVEHYRPKSRYPHLVVDWDNLALACDRCNQYKADAFDEELRILWPYEDDIDAHLIFVGPFVWGQPNSSRGRHTESQLRLNEVERVERRTDVLLAARRLAELWAGAQPILRSAYEEEINKFVARTDYSASARAYFRLVGVPVV